MIRRFTTCRSAVLIISYETFRIHQKHFKKGAQVRAAGGWAWVCVLDKGSGA